MLHRFQRKCPPVQDVAVKHKKQSWPINIAELPTVVQKTPTAVYGGVFALRVPCALLLL